MNNLDLKLIQNIHRAPLEPAKWQNVLEDLRIQTGASSGNLIQEGPEPGNPIILASTEIDQKAIEDYNQHYHKLDSWLLQSLSSKYKNQSILIGSEIVSDPEFLNSEWYNDFLRPLDVGRLISGRLLGNPDRVDCFSLYRPWNMENFDRDARDMIRQITPHVTNACAIYRYLVDLEQRVAATEKAFDALPVGIILLDRKGLVVHANTLAWQILDRRDGLDVQRKKLTAAIAEEQQQLDRLVGSTAATGQGNMSQPGGTMTLSRRSMKRPYSLLVAPISDTGSDQFGLYADTQPSAIVVLHDPELVLRPPLELLFVRYGLTPAEARLAAELTAGSSLQSAAEKFGVAKDTVRSQLKQILIKTDVKRQVDLVRLLISDLAGLAASGFRDSEETKPRT